MLALQHNQRVSIQQNTDGLPGFGIARVHPGKPIRKIYLRPFHANDVYRPQTASSNIARDRRRMDDFTLVL